MKHNFKFLFFLFAGLLVTTGCEKRLELKADNQIASLDELITSGEDAERVLTSAYDVMANVFDGDIQTIAELLSDNAGLTTNNDLRAVYFRETLFFNSTTNGYYGDLYRIVFRANSIIDYIDNATDLSNTRKAELLAEAKFLRALAHFWVLKVYAQPWGYTADNSHLGIVIRDEVSNEPKPRSTVAQCYAFILNDLVEAHADLPVSNGIYATKDAAAAMLAYVYYMQNDYTNCEAYASEVINSGRYTLHADVDVFEALDTTLTFPETSEGIFFAHSYPSLNDARNDNFKGYIPGTAPASFSMSEEFYNFMSLNPADKRFNQLVAMNASQGQWHSLRFGRSSTTVNQFFSVPILRLSVLKLIRAEALASLGTNLSTAIGDLNDLRERAFPEGTDFELDPNLTATQVVQQCWEEFRKETFCEGLWLDVLRRRGAMGEDIQIRNAPWNCPGMAIQFPNSEGTGSSFIFNPERGCN